MSLEQKIKDSVRDILDFPSPKIVFKDITPILKNVCLFNEIVNTFADKYKDLKIDKIAAIEARGFIFGAPLAARMKLPFVPIRKKGKLPAEVVSASYNLEYGSAIIEIHKDAVVSGENILLVDDLLATGGTLAASYELIKKLNGNLIGAAFVVELDFLKGREREDVRQLGIDILSLAKY
jgi:adenine phosphoribosyltransferase